MKKFLMASVFVAVVPNVSYAGMAPQITLEQAQKAIKAALAASPEDTMSVWVVDKDGVPIAMAHPNCAPTIGVSGALGKAVVSAYFGAPSLNFDPRFTPQPNPNPTITMANTWKVSGWEPMNFAKGGVPIKRMDHDNNLDTVGAIACGGGTPDQDQTCADAGAAVLNASN